MSPAMVEPREATCQRAYHLESENAFVGGFAGARLARAEPVRWQGLQREVWGADCQWGGGGATLPCLYVRMRTPLTECEQPARLISHLTV